MVEPYVLAHLGREMDMYVGYFSSRHGNMTLLKVNRPLDFDSNDDVASANYGQLLRRHTLRTVSSPLPLCSKNFIPRQYVVCQPGLTSELIAPSPSIRKLLPKFTALLFIRFDKLLTCYCLHAVSSYFPVLCYIPHMYVIADP